MEQPFGNTLLDLGAGGPEAHDRMDDERRDTIESLLKRARKWWMEDDDFRQRRARSRDYRLGEQWQETTEAEDGSTITEEEYIQNQGRIPWVINQIASVVRNLKGQYRQNTSDRAVFAVEKENSGATEQMNVKRRGTRRYNRAETVESDQFEEHVLAGRSGFKVTFDWQADLGRREVEIDPIDNTRLFYNRDLQDRRMKHLRLIGELHDLTKEELLATYARDENGDFDPELAEQIKEVYSHIDELKRGELPGASPDQVDGISFYSAAETGLARVIEVWTQRRKITRYVQDPEEGEMVKLDDAGIGPEQIGQLNAQRAERGEDPVRIRRKVEPTWVVHHLSPRGDVLFEQETPYWHGKHPYVIGLANLVDGKTWGLVEQIIDPQRWLNRLVAMIDHALGIGAKGVLLVPEQTIPDDLDIDDFAEEWSRQGGVIKIKLKKGAEPPQQITTNAIQKGSFQLLQQMKQWIEEVSGVTGAQQGQEPKSGTPAMLFQQQVIQSGLTNLDYFESFFEAIRELDYKVVTCIQQAVDRPVTLSEGATQEPIDYKPEDVRNLRFDVSVGSVKDTATFRQIFEDDLRGFLEGGFIDFGTYLQMSAHPKSETLLRVLQQRDPSVLDLGTTEMQAATAALTEGGAPAQGAPTQGAPAGGDGAAPELTQRGSPTATPA